MGREASSQVLTTLKFIRCQLRRSTRTSRSSPGRSSRSAPARGPRFPPRRWAGFPRTVPRLREPRALIHSALCQHPVAAHRIDAISCWTWEVMQRRSPRRRRVSCWSNATIAYASGCSFAIMAPPRPEPTQTRTRGHNTEHISSMKCGMLCREYYTGGEGAAVEPLRTPPSHEGGGGGRHGGRFPAVQSASTARIWMTRTNRDLQLPRRTEYVGGVCCPMWRETTREFKIAQWSSYPRNAAQRACMTACCHMNNKKRKYNTTIPPFKYHSHFVSIVVEAAATRLP